MKFQNPYYINKVGDPAYAKYLPTLQIANLGATIANRGYYITPHVVKEVEDEPLDTLYTDRKSVV